MQIKYKLKNKETGLSYTDIKSYNLDKEGNVISVIVGEDEIVITSHHKFNKFLEKVGGKDGVDVYNGDKAIVDITYFNYDSEEDDDSDYITETFTGEFRELWEEGLYYFCTEDGDDLSYSISKTKVIKFL